MPVSRIASHLSEPTDRRLRSVAATLTDPLLGRLVDGRYEVLSRIARGGMATVYLAVDRRLDREVALKVMHPHLAEGTTGTEFIARFRREARAAARLTHPGLVGVLDQGVDGETSYLAMEYVEGTDLRHRLTEDGPLTVGNALRTVEVILEALAVAHRVGLVHRDIKPENVLIALDGRIKVADFGLARAVTEVTYTATGTVLGTVAYLAPELVSHGTVDPRTDVYAAGILLFEMLTGAQPYTGSTPIQVAYQHVNSEVPAPSGRVRWLPKEIDELVAALTARDPSGRPADAASALQLVRRTRAVLDDELLARHADAPPRPAVEVTTQDSLTDDVSSETIEDAPADASDDPPENPDATATLTAVETRQNEKARHNGKTDHDVEDGLRRTIALRIGVGLAPTPPPPVVEPTAHPLVQPKQWRSRVGLFVGVVMLAAALGAGTWWFIDYGPVAWRAVPSGLVGVDRATAEAKLTAEGLGATFTEAFDPQVAAGLVVSTSPAEGDRVRKDGTVALVISKGPDMRTVPPDLIGAPFADVKAALELAGFEVAEPTNDYHDTVPVGSVIAMSAESGASLAFGSEITLLVSEGPAPVTIPGVVGMERQAGIVELESLGLVVEPPTEDYSETVPAGSIVSQNPADGTDGHRGDTVTLVVSLGPPLVAVPNVVGKQFTEAEGILVGLGFQVTRENVLGGYFGTVRDQSVPEGQSAQKGSSITLTVV
jgi:serine/threonine protein kinase/beta-lactam-binding protein with PASTA domain